VAGRPLFCVIRPVSPASIAFDPSDQLKGRVAPWEGAQRRGQSRSRGMLAPTCSSIGIRTCDTHRARCLPQTSPTRNRDTHIAGCCATGERQRPLIGLGVMHNPSRIDRACRRGAASPSIHSRSAACQCQVSEPLEFAGRAWLCDACRAVCQHTHIELQPNMMKQVTGMRDCAGRARQGASTQPK
jgi:hypothetical protein